MAMPSVFVSYRREDSRHLAERLYDRLVAQFGSGQVFKDVDSIPLGLDFREVLTERVGNCDVLIAVIGETWVSITGTNGLRRLDDPADFVRIEIETALSRRIPVIPVLVGNSSVPRAEELPENLRGLVYRNGLPVRPDPDFHNDVDRLIRGIEEGLSVLLERSAPHSPKSQSRGAEGRNSSEKKSSIDLRDGSSAKGFHSGAVVSSIGLLSAALGFLAPVVLSFALLLTLGVSGTWDEVAIWVSLATGIIFGGFQIFAGVSLLKLWRWARKFAVRHAQANMAVLLLFYLYGLIRVPKNSRDAAFEPLFWLVISCIYPAAVWILLSRPSIRALFEDAPKAGLAAQPHARLSAPP
jgi:hypothetical protein